MRAEIISVGTELLLGDIVNTNAQFLAQQLAGLGYEVYYQTVVGDNALRLRNLISEAKERSDILLFTGGLGPTEDDLTKEVVAEAFGDILVMDVDEEVKLEFFFKKRGLTMTENNRKQALVPKRGQKIENPNGTAPGAYFRQGSKYAILMPGPPREMQPMFTEQVMPLLEAMQDGAIRSVTLRVYGIGESELESRVSEFLEGTNPTAALYAKTGEVHIRITAKAATAEAADTMCNDYARLFLRALGDLVYSVNGDDLETTVVKLLIEEGATLATAESCTGGLLGERITSVPGASAVYGYGNITYANEAKHRMLGVRNGTLQKYGAVSSQVAAEMAFGAARRAGDTYGIGITGIAGPDGGTAEKPVGLVYIALARGKDVLVKQINTPDRGREYTRHMATQNALDMLRRELLGLAVPGAQAFTRSQEADLDRMGRPRRRTGPLVRAAVGVLLAVVLFVLMMLFGSTLRQNRDTPEAPSGLPSSQGLTYGTDEYTLAACALVEREKESDPNVTGFVAMPGARLETLVVKSSAPQGELEAADEAATRPALAQDAAPGRTDTNTLVAAADAFAPLLEWQGAEASDEPSTFTWYTASDAKVYQVFAVYAAEENGGYDPAAESLPTYGAFLDFTLGAKARSLYDIPVDLAPGDSYMTLAAEDPDNPGQSLYVCGRLTRPDEDPATPGAVRAAAPLMPAGWYAAQAQPQPAEEEVYGYWMRWYLSREDSNPMLQLYAGLAPEDAMPLVTPQSTPVPSGSSSSQPESAASLPDSSASEGASSSDAASSTPASADGAAAWGSGEVLPLAFESTNPAGGDGGDGGDAGGRGQDSTAPSSSASSSVSSSASGSDASGSGSEESSSEAPPSSSSSALYIPPRAVPQMPDPANLTVTLNGNRVTAPTAEVLAQICQAEVPGAGDEVVKAVAIAAHSWILNRQGAGDDAPAVVGRQPSAAVQAAVSEVAGNILTAGGVDPAFTPWYRFAAFGTCAATDVWGLSRNYLGSVPSPYDQDYEDWRLMVTVPQAEFAAMVQSRLGVDLTKNDDVALWITKIEKNEGGYVKSLLVGGEEVSGADFWQRVLVRDGVPLLRSSAFEVELDGEDIVFLNYGDGHGCGMSLAGAASYAREGWRFDRILEHYYPGTELIELQW